MGRKNTKGTQKINPILDASVESPPYETALGMTNTKEVKRSKQDKQVGIHSCKCKNKKTKNVRKRTRTWESIKDLYGDADTTEVWDDQQQTPKVVFSPKSHKKENPRENIDESENNDVLTHPMANVENTPAKLSIIGLYRKHKNDRNKIKMEQYAHKNSMDTDVISSPHPEPKVTFLLPKKTKKVKPNYTKSNYAKPNYATGDICTQGPCREALENLYHLQGLKYNPNQQDNITYDRIKSGYKDTSKKQMNKTKTSAKENKIIKKSKNKQVKAIKTTKGGNVGYGDQISPIPLKNQDVKDVLSKYSFTRKKARDTVCKCKNKLQTDSDQISPIPLKNQDVKDVLSKYSFIRKKARDTVCKCKNNNVNKLQTDSDKISPMPLKNQDGKDVVGKFSFIDKMMGHTVCKCKNNYGNKFQTDGDQISPVSLKNQGLEDVQCKCSFIGKMLGHTICKCKNNNENKFQTDGDQISPVSLKNPGLEDVQCKCSFIGKMLGHTICKCKNNNGSTLQTSSNVNNDNSKKEKNQTITPIRENKIINKSKYKQAKSIKITKDGNVGYGDQISPIPLKNQDGKDVEGKYSFIDKIMGHTICKCKHNNGISLQTSSNVNNDNIIKEKLKTKTHRRVNKNIKKSKIKQAKSFKTTKDGNVDVLSNSSSIGKMVRHTICKCKNNYGDTLQTSNYVNDQTGDPLLKMKVNLTDMRVINSSEINEKIRKLGRTKKHMSCICPSRINREVCERGPCIKALDNPYSHFDCKCQKQKIIDCKDSTCDLKIGDIKVKSRIKKKPQSSVYNKDQKPLFELMLDPAKMKIMNSKEVKRIIRETSQNNIICPTGICNTMSKKRQAQINCKCVAKKLSPYINDCTERTCRDEEQPQRSRKVQKRRNGVMINLPHGRTQKKGTDEEEKLSDVLCKCKEKKPEKKINKKPDLKKRRRRRRRRGFFRKKKKDYRTLTEKILDCLEREQEECEYRVMRKAKEYEKNEKKAIKENKKMLAEQKKAYKANSQHSSCVTNFISGFLNVGFESVKTVFKITFSVIGDPISSYVYVKEKIKNPPAAIIRILEWFVRTWGNKTTAIAKAVEDSGKLKVIADQIEDSALYNVVACRSKSGQVEHERRSRIRKRRMQKRHDEALYGCRHMMLTTMRKTPHLWFYHICPDLYPQCLGLTQFMTNFLHILLYCGAVMCWTPCIVFCEMCRAFMCCFLCTN